MCRHPREDGAQHDRNIHPQKKSPNLLKDTSTHRYKNKANKQTKKHKKKQNAIQLNEINNSTNQSFLNRKVIS